MIVVLIGCVMIVSGGLGMGKMMIVVGVFVCLFDVYLGLCIVLVVLIGKVV